MTKQYIKIDENKNVIAHPESEESLIRALGTNFNANNSYIEYRELPVEELTEVIYPPEREYELNTDENGEEYFTCKRIERHFSQEEKTFIFIKARRDFELRATDWIVLPGSPCDEQELQAWYEYRQALRDLPKLYPNVNSADEVEWPAIPNPSRLGRLGVES